MITVDKRVEYDDPTEEPSVRLSCWHVSTKVAGINIKKGDNGKEDRPQYDVSVRNGLDAMPKVKKLVEEHQELNSTKDLKTAKKGITAYKVPFLGSFLLFDPKLITSGLVLTIDHLCHDKSCLNPWHHDVTYITVNQSRAGCRPGTCKHDSTGDAKKCIIAGSSAFCAGIVPFLTKAAKNETN